MVLVVDAAGGCRRRWWLSTQVVVVYAVMLTRGCLAVLGLAWFSGDCWVSYCQFCRLGGLQRILNTVLGVSTCLLVLCVCSQSVHIARFGGGVVPPLCTLPV